MMEIIILGRIAMKIVNFPNYLIQFSFFLLKY